MAVNIRKFVVGVDTLDELVGLGTLTGTRPGSWRLRSWPA